MIRWLGRALFVLVSVVLLLLEGFLITYWVVDRTNGTLVSGGETRRYLLYVPESYDPAVPAPLVISLHGLVQWPAHQMRLTGWNALADEQGFIVVYPRGTGFPLRWRAGGFGADTETDVTFIADLIDTLEAEYAIDPERIYVNGMSNGGGMSFVLSCALSERIAAIGTVAGAYSYPFEACQPARPVPAIVYHGTADPIVAFHGSAGGTRGPALPDIPTWVATLAQRNGCSDVPTNLPPTGDVSGIAYPGCAADVVFYTVAGGGHTWPGGDPIPTIIAGPTNMDVNATREMWAFFDSHPRP